MGVVLPPPATPLPLPELLLELEELESVTGVVVHAEPEQVIVFVVLSVFVAVPYGLLVIALEIL